MRAVLLSLASAAVCDNWIDEDTCNRNRDGSCMCSWLVEERADGSYSDTCVTSAHLCDDDSFGTTGVEDEDDADAQLCMSACGGACHGACNGLAMALPDLLSGIGGGGDDAPVPTPVDCSDLDTKATCKAAMKAKKCGKLAWQEKCKKTCEGKNGFTCTRRLTSTMEAAVAEFAERALASTDSSDCFDTCSDHCAALCGGDMGGMGGDTDGGGDGDDVMPVPTPSVEDAADCSNLDTNANCKAAMKAKKCGKLAWQEKCKKTCDGKNGFTCTRRLTSQEDGDLLI